MKPVRHIQIDGDLAFVPLTNGYVATIDASDIHLVDGYNWYALVQKGCDGRIKSVYAVRTDRSGPKQVSVRMHMVIAGTTAGVETDHRNGDGLDNRRSNLRLATTSQNQHNQRTRIDNTSGVKGVTIDQRTGRWVARIRIGGKRVSLGGYRTVAEAAIAYESASKRLHGEFRRTA